jgi:hypothetical protein
MFKRNNITVVLLLGLAAGHGAVRTVGGPNPAALQTGPSHWAWQQEFDDLCARTQDAMAYSVEELAVLIKRCDALLPHLEALDDTQKKVYRERLRMCRGVYAYVLDSKKNDSKQNEKNEKQ